MGYAQERTMLLTTTARQTAAMARKPMIEAWLVRNRINMYRKNLRRRETLRLITGEWHTSARYSVHDNAPRSCSPSKSRRCEPFCYQGTVISKTQRQRVCDGVWIGKLMCTAVVEPVTTAHVGVSTLD